jgi:hypothetical protein
MHIFLDLGIAVTDAGNIRGVSMAFCEIQSSYLY